MEPSSLKDYLEALLAERSDRLMGGSIKHFGSDLCPSDLCYKEVLPANAAAAATTAAADRISTKGRMCQAKSGYGDAAEELCQSAVGSCTDLPVLYSRSLSKLRLQRAEKSGQYVQQC